MSAELVSVAKEMTEFQVRLQIHLNEVESMVLALENMRKLRSTLEIKLDRWTLQLKELENMTTVYDNKAVDVATLMSPCFDFVNTLSSIDSDSCSNVPPITSAKTMFSVALPTETEPGADVTSELSLRTGGEVTDGKVAGSMQQALNPLEIPLILENIFSYLGHQDLNTCRQVCTLWRTYCTTSWRASAHVHIICGRGSRRSNATQFVKFVRKRGMQYRRSQYNKFTVTILGPALSFWNVCGPYVKVLRLHSCRFDTIDDFRRVVYQCCPNMQELDLGPMSFESDMTIPTEPAYWTAPKYGEKRTVTTLTARVHTLSIPVSWMELISHFPQLRVLNLQGGLRSTRGRGRELFSTLAILLEQNSIPIKLRHICNSTYRYFHHTDDIPRELVTAVELPHLHLESVSVWMNEPDATVILSRILAANATTLKKLRLCRNYTGTRLELNDSFRLPGEVTQLVNLQEIDLLCDNFESLSFLRFAPNLKKLTLSQLWPYLVGSSGIVERTNLLEMDGVALASCSELKIEFEIMTQELQTLCSLMPNVTKLWTKNLGGVELEFIRASWPNVELQG